MGLSACRRILSADPVFRARTTKLGQPPARSPSPGALDDEQRLLGFADDDR